MDLSDVNDGWLYTQLTEGRESAAVWAEFLRRFQLPCYRVIRRVLTQRLGRGAVDDLSDEMFQSFFATLLADDRRLLKRFRGDGGCTPRTYLCYLAGYHVLSVVRSRRGLPEQYLWSHQSLDAEETASALSDTEGISPQEHVESRELLGHTLEALNSLSEGDQRLFQLIYAENLPMAEVAEALGLTSSALRVQHHRLRKRIRTHLESRGHKVSSDEESRASERAPDGML